MKQAGLHMRALEEDLTAVHRLRRRYSEHAHANMQAAPIQGCPRAQVPTVDLMLNNTPAYQQAV